MKASYTSSEQFERNALRGLSGRIGHNPLLVQASSGNTSIKIDDVLWIKASGKWLIHSEDDDFLVPVRLAKAKRCLQEGTAIPETGTSSPGSPGASVETAMHAVLPQKVVVHVHSVNAIAWAVREDGPRELSGRLAGFAWRWIPYTPSGISLAREIEQALACFPRTNVFVLANHGLVVCGSSCHSAEQLLAEVEQCLSIEPRPVPEPDYTHLQAARAGSAWSVPACARVHALATDHISRRILSGGILYPCQAIFLPGIMSVLASSLHLPPSCSGQPDYAGQQVLRVIADQGVLASEQMTRAEREMLTGLANVVQRIDASAPLRYLSASEVTDLLNGELDHYKQTADTLCYSKGSGAGA